MIQGTQSQFSGQPRGMEWGGRREGVQDQEAHVHPWVIHVEIRQKHHNIVNKLSFD